MPKLYNTEVLTENFLNKISPHFCILQNYYIIGLWVDFSVGYRLYYIRTKGKSKCSVVKLYKNEVIFYERKKEV